MEKRVMSSHEFVRIFGEILGIPKNCIRFTIVGDVNEAISVTAQVLPEISDNPSDLESINSEMKQWTFAKVDEQ